MVGLDVPPDEKAKTAKQGAGEPDTKGLGAKNAKSPIGKEEINIKR